MKYLHHTKSSVTSLSKFAAVAKIGTRKLLAVSLAAAAVLILAPVPAEAATATTTMAVSATVLSVCTVLSAPMIFGNYSNGSATSSTTIVTPICTNSTPYTIGLGAGASAGATVTNRAMSVVGLPAVLLDYNLTSDAAHTVNYATSASITGSGLGQPITIYGIIPSGQTIAPGVYQDTVAVTITY